jgi:hypothetical protein
MAIASVPAFAFDPGLAGRNSLPRNAMVAFAAKLIFGNCAQNW